MNEKAKTAIILISGLLLIPLMHLCAPIVTAWLTPDSPQYVATESGSIIGQGNNIYLQLLPYLLAYLLSPVLIIWSLVRVIKQRRKTSE